jgi:predicted GNAT family N-acyltransferase
MNALHTAYLASQTVASWAVVVDAKQGAKDFYLKYGFAPFLDDGDRLFLPMNSIANSTSIGG